MNTTKHHNPLKNRLFTKSTVFTKKTALFKTNIQDNFYGMTPCKKFQAFNTWGSHDFGAHLGGFRRSTGDTSTGTWYKWKEISELDQMFITSWWTDLGLIAPQYLAMPYGLAYFPVFQCLVNNMLRDLLGKCHVSGVMTSCLLCFVSLSQTWKRP